MISVGFNLGRYSASFLTSEECSTRPLRYNRCMRTCEVHRLHLVTYENGMNLQQKLVEMRQQELLADQLLLLEHPPVITIGRGGDRANLLGTPEGLRAAGVRFFETTRGGDITYHGPGQLVGYPIIHLGEGNRDIRKYVTKLEEVLIRTVADYGIVAERLDGKRGIWVGRNKIAAIGVRIARWVTSHGWALNVSTDLDHFRLITPCGLHGMGVTSIARELGRYVDPVEVRERLLTHFAEIFEREVVDRPPTIRLIKVVVHDGAGRVLLLHRRPERGRFWQPITGTIEPGESVMAAALREIVEETGHEAVPHPLSLHQSFMIESQFLSTKHGSPVMASEAVFTAVLDSTLPITLDSEEHDDFGWFTFAAAYDRIQWTDDREAIEMVERIAGLTPAPQRATA